MATKVQVDKLQSTLKSAHEYLAKDLLSRPAWGEITFEAAGADIKKLRELVGYFAVLPLEHLPEGHANAIEQHLQPLVPTLQAIDKFTIAGGNAPIQQRDGLVNQLHSQLDTFATAAGPWLPFLAYQQGDVAANIEKLSRAADESRALMERAEADVKVKSDEIGRIIVAAREASAAAGAAVFTSDFREESDRLERGATKWLGAAAVFVAATLMTASYFIYLARQPIQVVASSGPTPAAAPAQVDRPAVLIGPGVVPAVAATLPAPLAKEELATLSASQVAQVVVAKLIILTLLLTAATWCGRTYKALKHLAVVNRHRSLSLKTLNAFSAAASDDLTKNAVLLEATRAIFSAGATGYVDSKDGADDSSSLRIVEIAKGLGTKSGT